MVEKSIGKLALCATESNYQSHGKRKLSKVLTLSGLTVPMPLLRNKVAIILKNLKIFGNFKKNTINLRQTIKNN